MMRKFGTATELVCALEIRCGINRHRGHALRRGDVNGGLATGRVSGLRSGKNGSSAKHKTSHQLSRLRNLRLSIFNTPTLSTPHPSLLPSIPAKWPPLLLPLPPASARSMPQRPSSRPLTLPRPLALLCTRDSLSPVPSAAPSPTEPSHPSMCTLCRPPMAPDDANGCLAHVLRQLTGIENDDRMPS
jgi:hypothetical protein